MEDEKFDGILMSVVQQSQGINGFFDVFFGFLRRKTDFFAQPESGKLLLDKAFNANVDIYTEQKRIQEAKQRAADEKKRREQELKTQKVVEITDEEAEKIAKEESAKKATHSAPTPVERAEPSSEMKKEGEEEEETGQIPVGNGGTTDRYTWTQTLGEVTTNFFLPQDATAKVLKVDVGVTKLKITLKGQVLVEGEFYARIKADDHLWTIDTIDGRKVLSLTFDKLEGMTWWKTVLKGDPEINTKKVEPENSKLSDLDEETRPTVEKMMLDQQRKARGLPSVEEEEKQNMLKKFMAAHPEMDFSKVKLS